MNMEEVCSLISPLNNTNSEKLMNEFLLTFVFPHSLFVVRFVSILYRRDLMNTLE